MKKKIVFGVILLLIIITFGIFNFTKKDDTNKLKEVKVAEPTLT